MSILINKLSLNKTILALIPSIEYNKSLVKTVRELSKEGSICYVTLNKTFDSLIELFENKHINVKNIVFVDAITKTFKQVPNQAENVYFCTSPDALTEISITIKKMLEHNFKFLIFDSLTNLIIYSKKEPIAQFVANLVNKIKTSNTSAIFYAVRIKERKEIINEMGMFVDEAIELGGG
jgi:archaellum biogenesis ATPase FlaH